MKAMILAAGRGERLRPLTDTVPKALVEVRRKPLIAWHLERLAACGCTEAVVNVSHLGERIVETIGDGARFGLAIRYSREASPLETAGGIANAAPLLGPDPFLVVNADVFAQYDFSLLLEARLGTRLAHLVLVPNPAHRAAGDFALEGGLVGNDGPSRYTYSGMAVISPRLVAGVPAGTKAALAPLLRQAAAEGRVSGELFAGLWRDIGTKERLDELEAHLTRNESIR